MTKIESHRGSKDEIMSCGGCSEHKNYARHEWSSVRAPLRLQGGSRVLDGVSLMRQARGC